MSTTVVSIPKYRHHKGSGQAFVQVNGRRHYLGKWDSPKSKEVYARFVAELAVSPVVPRPNSPASQLTMLELMDAYWQFAVGYYQKDGRPTRYIDDIKLALRPVKMLYSTTLVTSFGPLALQAIQGQLANRHLARKTINSITSTIKRMFKWAVSRELIPPHIYQALATVEGLRRGRGPNHPTTASAAGVGPRARSATEHGVSEGGAGPR